MSQIRKINGFDRHTGNHKEICRKIIDKCWNDGYFQVSTGHFKEFYTRDFTFCCEHLIRLGHRKKVIKTIDYALSRFRKLGRMTSTINTKGKPIDIFTYSAESLPFMLRCIRLSKANHLLKKYNDFLEKETRYYYDCVFDKKTGLVQKKVFSSMKDNSLRESSCYDNCMLGLLKEELSKAKLPNPFKHHDIKKKIKDNYWNGTYFLDTPTTDHVAGDANTFPYWTGLFTSKKMIRSSIETLQEEGLDFPFPLRYTKVPLKGEARFPLNILLPDYETNTIWAHLGLCYIEVVRNYDKRLAKDYLSRYKGLIEKHKNFLEIYWPDGSPFKTPLYCADHNMLWASMYLNMIGRLL